jgi:hypothetical protein
MYVAPPLCKSFASCQYNYYHNNCSLTIIMINTIWFRFPVLSSIIRSFWDVSQVNSIVFCNPTASLPVAFFKKPKIYITINLREKHSDSCMTFVLANVAREKHCIFQAYFYRPRDILPGPKILNAQIIVIDSALNEQQMSAGQFTNNLQMECLSQTYQRRQNK